MNKFPSNNNYLKTEIYILVGLIVLSLFLNFYNIDFPLGYHVDEVKKIKFLKLARQDFHHPILMLQAVRILKRIIPIRDEGQLILLSRSVSALSGMVIVLATFYIARIRFNRFFSSLVASTVAVVPIIVTHAHYFKEDMIFTACTMLALLCFFYYLRVKNGFAVFLVGLLLGLSCSAQYKGLITLVLFLMAPAYLSQCRNSRYFKHCIIYFFVTLIVFAVVNYPMFIKFGVFMEGVRHESHHIATGHTLRIDPIHSFFSFHLLHSIVPGISWPVTLLSLAGLAISLIFWKKESDHNKVLFLYCILFYFVHEISLSKPAPDYSRYVIPIIPALIYFAFYSLVRIFNLAENQFFRNISGKIVTACCLIILIAPLIYSSIMFDYYFNKDTRKQASIWINEKGEKALYEFMATHNRDFDILTIDQLDVEEARAQGISYFVSSSFRYDRYYRGAQMPNQVNDVYDIHRKYEKLFSCPYVEIKPKFKTYAFSNPTIRIVDIRNVNE